MKNKLLIVDDDLDDLEVFCEAVNKTGYDFNCMTADSCDRCIKKLLEEKEKTDLILLDYNMPHQNGKEC